MPDSYRATKHETSLVSADLRKVGTSVIAKCFSIPWMPLVSFVSVGITSILLLVVARENPGSSSLVVLALLGLLLWATSLIVMTMVGIRFLFHKRIWWGIFYVSLGVSVPLAFGILGRFSVV